MKKILSVIIISTTFFSCGGEEEKSLEAILSGNNLEEIRAKRAEISDIHTSYSEKLKELDKKIAELDSTKKIPLITSLIVSEKKFNHYVELQGNVSTKSLIVVYPEFPGILKRVKVTEGQIVKKGDVLANIDDGGLTPQLAQIQIQAHLAKTTFERQQRLWKKKIGSEIQYLQAKTNYEAQLKVINQMEEQIAKTVVKAPFDGIVDEIITEQGNMVSPGISPLMRIVNLNNMYIETDVPEKHITTVTKNKSVEVNIPVLGKNISTKVSKVGNYINPANRTFKIEIPVPNLDKMIKPNLTAKIKVNDYTNEKAILIQQSIISENAEGKQYVYVVNNKNNNLGIAKKVFITTGKTEGDLIEVLDGVKNGAEVIQEGARSIKDGQEVKVLTQQ